MKILLINPNTSANMTERMVRAAADVLAPDVELVAITATRGMPYIASRAEAVIAGAITLEMLAEHHRGTDAGRAHQRLQGARPGVSRRPLLDSAMELAVASDRLLGRVQPSRDKTALWPWRSGDLVV